jgi:hypothetical protein
MKYLRILPLALVATIASQNVMAIGEGAYKAADSAMAAKTLSAQNARLDVLGLPKDNAYRAAMVAAGGVGATKSQLILQVLETGGAAGILHGNAAQQNAVDAMLLLPGANLAKVADADTILAAVDVQALIIAGHVLGGFTENSIKTAYKLRKPAVALPVNWANFQAAHFLRNPQGGGAVAAVTVANVTAAQALLNAVGAPVPVNAANVDAAVLLAPYVAGGGGRQLNLAQVDAVKDATAVNANVRGAMVWAITNGFGGQPVGTVPAGIARVALAGADSTLTVMYGAPPFGANAARFAGNDMIVQQANIGGGLAAPALNSLIVFTGVVDDGGNPNNVITQNSAVVP